MKEWLLFISSIAAGCVRITVCLFLIFRLLSAKKPEKKNAAAELMGAVLLSALTFLAGWSGFYSMALETVWIVLCSIRFQKADARMSMFLGISYEITVSFWQFLFAAWLGFCFVLRRLWTLALQWGRSRFGCSMQCWQFWHIFSPGIQKGAIKGLSALLPSWLSQAFLQL